MNVLAMFR